MNAVEYLKIKGRMTNECEFDYCTQKCPLNSRRNKTNESCSKFEAKYPEQAVAIVEQWAKENPVKTYLSVLLEKLPNAKLTKEGIPVSCINCFFGEASRVGCDKFNSCIDCWNKEYKEEK